MCGLAGTWRRKQTALIGSFVSEDFKRQMEADAAERAENKKKAKTLSDAWKEKAIASFRAGKYDDALEKYNKVTHTVITHVVIARHRFTRFEIS